MNSSGDGTAGNALHAQGEQVRAMQVFGDVLALAQPGGFVRTFVDERFPMARLERFPH